MFLMTKVLLNELGCHLPRLDFRRIVRVSVSQMLHQIPQGEKNRMPAELQHVREFVKDEFDGGSIRGIYRAMLGA